MLNQQPRGNSRAPAPIEPISTSLRIAPEGLVLGSGTILLPADAPRQLRTTKGREARVLALLSAAYDRAVDPAVLGNIERAAKAWNSGDDCLAYIHLAHARLGELQYPHDAAQRLVIVDAFLKAGGSPRTVFKGLKLDAPYIDALEKEYNSAEPRVPQGSGKPSGEWTRGGEVARPPVPTFAPNPPPRRCPLLGLASSVSRRWWSSAPMLSAFSALVALPQRHSGSSLSRLQTMFTSKAKYRESPGYGTRGIATRRCFTSLMMAATASNVLSQPMLTAISFATNRAASSAVCFLMAAF